MFYCIILGEVVKIVGIVFYLDNVFFVVNRFLFIKEMNVYGGDSFVFIVFCFRVF